MQHLLKRSWQLGQLARALVRVRRHSGSPTEAAARQRMAAHLGTLHGLPQKIGQILALSELSTPEQVYTPLTEMRAALESDAAFAEMEHELGCKLSACFSHIEPAGIAASFAQVHRAVLKDGRPVAIKLQYPQISQTLRLDLQALGWLTAPVGGLKRGFDLAGYRREVGQMLTTELDYRHEAHMLKSFFEWTRTWETVQVPEVIDELSGARLLTMTWLEGAPFAGTHDWSVAERQQLGTTLLRLFLTSCFVWHTLHGDPHPGNYRFMRRAGQPIVGLLDFGCVKQLGSVVVEALSGLLQDVLTNRLAQAQVLARYQALGFNLALLEPLAPRLPALSRILFEPFVAPQPYQLAEWKLGARVAALLGEERWNFRCAGPPDLIYFMRAYQGLIQYLQAVAVPLNWRRTLEEVWQPPIGAPAPITARRTSTEITMKSQALCIQVTENGETRVKLTFRASAAAHLPELVPDELLPQLAARAIDLHRLAQDASRRDFAPGELFVLQEEHKTVRVWLE